ncbi:hypothetical protein BDV10DRAFT_175589 [Aspergillus recurvatus]
MGRRGLRAGFESRIESRINIALLAWDMADLLNNRHYSSSTFYLEKGAKGKIDSIQACLPVVARRGDSAMQCLMLSCQRCLNIHHEAHVRERAEIVTVKLQAARSGRCRLQR